MNRFTPLFIGLLLMVGACTNPQSSSNAPIAVEIAKVSTPQEALVQLDAGNKRFVNNSSLFPNRDIERVKETAPKQYPFVTVVGCADSRVPIEIIYDQGIGDIFVVRTAANTINSPVIMGSIDYSVLHLGVKLIVVLGHGSCGGVAGAITEAGESHDDHIHVDALLQTVRDDVKGFVGKPEQIDEAIRCNVFAQVDKLKAVPHLKSLIDEGKLDILPAYYDINTGVVEVLKP